MKTTIFNGLAAFFATAILVSCKCDDKKPVTETNSTTTTTTITETTTTDSLDQAGGSGVSDVNSGNTVSNVKATGVKSTSKATVKSGKSKSKEDPDILVTRTKDGTDAENHDGNPYTKNDQTPQPTGPPIK